MLGIFVTCYLVSQLSTEEYFFREELNTPFIAKMGEYWIKGKVTRDGIFIPDVNERLGLADIFKCGGADGMRFKSSGAGGMRHLWISPSGHTKVYELRYGMLIPMTIRNGNFIPEMGEKIISFEDYRYTVFARPIYNLPGTWYKKGTVFDDDDKQSMKNITRKEK